MFTIAKGIATKLSLRIQGAQNSVTKEKVSDVKRIPALKTSSLILELRYRAIAATKRVIMDRASILVFLLLFDDGVSLAAKIRASPAKTI